MDWDSWNDWDKSTLKDSKNWFPWEYYLLSLFPLLIGTFLGGDGEKLRFFPLVLLAITVLFAKTAVSVFVSLREKQGHPIATREYTFVASKLPFEENSLRFIAYVTGVLSLLFGFILCLVSGFGLLTFGVLSLLIFAAYFTGTVQRHYAIDLLLVFCSTFFLTAAGYYSQTGDFSWNVLGISLPLGLLTAALLLQSEEHRAFDDMKSTVYGAFGSEIAKRCFTVLFGLAYIFVVLNVLYGVSGFWCLLLLALLPLAKKGLDSKEAFFAFYWKFGVLYAFCMLLKFTF